MKKIISIIIALSMLLVMCSCGRYVSSYMALGLMRNQTTHSCFASFQSLEGQLVFEIKKSDVGTEGEINYSVQLEKGEIRLYYDIYGTKEELAHVKAGESIENSGGYVEGGKPVYIIIEATDSAKGKVSVELD